MFCCHRINTVIELKNIPSEYGIEVDLRDNQDGEIYLAHDPFVNGELLCDFLNHYQHAFIILNIKSERIEYRVLELLKQHAIQDYFFLDSSFPMIYKLSSEGIQNIAIRYSEFEGTDTIVAMQNKIQWIWIDCFTKNPLDYTTYLQFKNMGYKLCFVSPELQNQTHKLEEYKDFFKNIFVPLKKLI